MLFHTPEFIALMIVSLVFFYAFPRWRIPILTIANMIFYVVAGVGNLLLFLAMTAFTYYCSKALRGPYSRFFLWFSIVVNVANLVFFKYTTFLIRSAENWLSIKLLTDNSFLLKIVLPIGISFYTFQMIAYLVDVYKKRWEPAQSLLRFWVFISFYAHLVAGPIMRGKEFMPQIDNLRKIRFSAANFRLGAFFLTLGIFKKVVLADYLTPHVDEFFSRTATLTGAEGWVAAYMFAFQIFFDFSAYSEMALGIAYFFGMELAVNFRTPYLSQNPTEFWRRWHITLSNWIKDYIYIPLGGSRNGEVRQYTNLFIAMTISGIWHGASWTFVAWGMFYGLLATIHKLYMMIKEKLGLGFLDKSFIYRFIAIVVFFHITCIAWVLFRVNGLRDALSLIKRMLRPEAFQFTGLNVYLGIVVLLFGLHVVEYFLHKHRSGLSEWWHKYFPAPVRAVVYTGIAALLILFLRGEQNTFIYFQF
ncbi:MBOAT family protein [Paenibacillus hemerocallicola]|jgi:alginate O-acetyltransferase complex protein AlgI|uniref:MBOAT family protein n=1 Tax=Paenibacillus hemerocallicola TaxID=1172614 RepID=A0A5C4SZ63_9BACL|nr:MBOAT family O-acyltransferase [Paenibacillus hemerocallicola]TNJ61986.1 MBOAT family protein [Paenibacillus hemerocallicola]